MRPLTRWRPHRPVLYVRWAAALAALVGFVAIASDAGAATTSAGFQAQSYASTTAGTAGGAVTGQKPESKLWFAQGSWWATMVVPTSGAHDIYRLVSGTWVDTGVLVDPESTTREDVLWDGSDLYVLSRAPTTSEANRLRRFSFSGGRYVLDPGFPVNVPGGGAEAVTIAKDSTGTLWLTYASSDRVKKVMVAHSLGGNDTSWGAAFQVPFSQASGLKGDDISAIIAFTDATGPAIGVEWDNENLESDFFAVHRDGASDSSWSVETTLSGTLQADDHMNLKTFEGRVYIAAKTATTTPTEPLIKLLVRSPGGNWAQYPVAPYADKNTRPIVLIDQSARQLYIFMSKGDNPAHGIYYKQTPLDAISFPSTATPFIVGANNQTINDGTSTKQNLDSTTGIVVMASDGSSYWWNGKGTGGPPANTPPAASPVNVSTAAGTPVTVTLAGSDIESCELGFAVTVPPANGTTGGFSSQPCTPGSPNDDSATVVYTPNSGFTGSDSFSYQVTDGSGATATATVSITVGATNSPPTADDVNATTQTGTPVTVTLSGSDVESCQLGFAVTQGPQHGSTGSVSGQGCNAGLPNTDTATVVYTPASGFVGTDTFTYQVADGSGATASGTATITVTGTGQPITLTPTSSKVTTGTLTGGDTSSLAASDDVYLSVASTTTNPQKTDWWGAFSGVPSSPATLSLSYEGASSAPCTQTIQIRNWTTAAWVTLDSRVVGTSDTTISGLTPSGTLSDYVDGSGSVKIRVSCQASGTSYTVRGDQLTVTYS